jgi:hypothetical protein
MAFATRDSFFKKLESNLTSRTSLIVFEQCSLRNNQFMIIRQRLNAFLSR